ncbi:MAG: glycosyltransferase family 9 protein [Deltaproteobacteria bacterium]|jgi:ADP-heptose:LPS heptosyltransferase|nr:glycosyltransferase family 9 protein [Deltaproteobacteria bacterium]
MRLVAASLQKLGDFIQLTPLLSALEKERPDCEFFLCFRERAVESALSLFFPAWQAVPAPEKSGEAPDKRLRGADILVNPSLSPEALDLIFRLKPKRVIGPRREKDETFIPAAQKLALAVMTLNRRLGRFNLVDLWRSLGEGAPTKLKAPGLPEEGDGDERFEARETEDFLQGPDPVVALHLGAGHRLRRHPAELASAALLRAERGRDLKILLIGTRPERALGLKFAKLHREASPGARILNLCGETDLARLSRLLKRCSLLIAADTGVAHLAAALEVPQLSLFFGPALGHETAPYREGVSLVQGLSPCGPCVENKGCARPACRALPPAELTAALVTELLGDGIGGEKSEEIAPSGGALFETWKGALSPRGFSLVPAPPLPRALSEETLAALVIKEAALDTVLKYPALEKGAFREELKKYPGPKREIREERIIPQLRFVAGKGVKEGSSRNDFFDRARELLRSAV